MSKSAIPCACCGKTAQELQSVPFLVCSGCRSRRYCSSACQKIHWRTDHKQECGQLRNVKTNLTQAFGQRFDSCVKTWSRVCHAGLAALACSQLNPFEPHNNRRSTHVVVFHLSYDNTKPSVRLIRYSVQSLTHAAKELDIEISLLFEMLNKRIPNRLVWTTFLFVCLFAGNRHVRVIPQSVRCDNIHFIRESGCISNTDILLKIRDLECGIP